MNDKDDEVVLVIIPGDTEPQGEMTEAPVNQCATNTAQVGWTPAFDQGWETTFGHKSN